LKTIEDEYLHAVAQTGVCTRGRQFFSTSSNFYRERGGDSTSLDCPFADGPKSLGVGRAYQETYNFVINSRSNLALSAQLCENVSLHKYTTPFKVRDVAENHNSVEEGITILLEELHASNNIGHASRDALFLAHVLQHVKPARIIVSDPISKSIPNEHRRMSIMALRESSNPKPEIYFFDGNLKSLPQTTSCFELILRKATPFAGFGQARDFYRAAAYSFCKLSALEMNIILVEQHVGSREWDNPDYIEQTIREQEWAKPYQVVSKKLNHLTFCQQVELFARSKVAFLHHGAAAEGNSPFMHPSALLVEIFGQSPQLSEENMDTIFGNGVRCGGKVEKFDRSPLYLSARIAYVASRRQDYHQSSEKVILNTTLWQETLNLVGSVIVNSLVKESRARLLSNF